MCQSHVILSPSLFRWGRSRRRSTTESKRTFCVKRLLTAEIAYRRDNTRRPTVPTQCQCRQCLADGHRAGDNVCSLIPEANNDTDVDDSSAFFTPTKNPPNQSETRQANKQNKTLITDYTTRQHKKSGAASDSQQMPRPARGRSPRRQNRAHSTRDDSLKRRRSPTGDTPPTDRRALLQEVAEQTGDDDSASEDRWSNCT